MKYLILALVSALALTGCASQDYARYTEANQAIETARHNADAAKWAAMAQIAGQQKKQADIEWNYSNDIVRTNGLVDSLALALGLTSAQIDALFIAAAKL